LFEIAVSVLTKKDDLTGRAVLDMILDRAAQKGTGKWTVIDALERGVALPTITEAVYARLISSEKETRQQLNKLFIQEAVEINISLDEFKKGLGEALYAGMLSIYAQGYALISKAAIDEGWEIDLSEISRIWEGGCIIRAKILRFIHQAYADPTRRNTHLFAIPRMAEALTESIPALRKTVVVAVRKGVPAGALGSALSYFERITQARGSANFIQGLRDYFGAHTFERWDREGAFHAEWE
jgi:6-phosphogluconate dehydrogenase